MEHASALASALDIPIAPMEFEIRAASEHAHRLKLGCSTLVTMLAVRHVAPDHVGPDAPPQHRNELDVELDFFCHRAHDLAPAAGEQIALLERYDCHSTVAATRAR